MENNKLWLWREKIKLFGMRTFVKSYTNENLVSIADLRFIFDDTAIELFSNVTLF